MGAERRADLRCSMSSRARMIPAPARRFPPMPGWARLRDVPRGADDAPFVAGAALAALHPIGRD